MNKSLSQSVSWKSDSFLDDFVYGFFDILNLNFISMDLIELVLVGEL